MYSLTIFTPTYNRGYILGRLKDSLCRQDNFDFEWLIIDDGSTDNTQELVANWQKETLPFTIRFCYTKHGGKPRAINMACHLAQSKWLFIVDSDDYLADEIIGFICNKLYSLPNDPTIIGLGGLRGTDANNPWRSVPFSDYVIASNTERPNYNLDIDCNEVYSIEILKQFPFFVWPGENFIPEEVVLNELAIHGYKLIWYNKVFVISHYLDDGLTKGAWDLLKKNPMGYAMLYNHKLKYQKNISSMIYNTIQFIAFLFIANNISYIKHCNIKWLAYICLPLGYLLSIRRAKQFKSE